MRAGPPQICREMATPRTPGDKSAARARICPQMVVGRPAANAEAHPSLARRSAPPRTPTTRDPHRSAQSVQQAKAGSARDQALALEFALGLLQGDIGRG